MSTDEISSAPSLTAKLGQLFMVGFYGLEPSDELIQLITTHQVGSVVLFSRNIASVEQLRSLTLSLQQIAKNAGHPHPLLIAVDQENGMVRRFGKMTTLFPGNMALGALPTSTIRTAESIARATAKELLALGINYDLAPVVDVNNNPKNPVIGIRSFGQDPHLCARLGSSMVKGFQECGVIACAKHFPGHGNTAVDSHYGLPVISKTRAQLEEVELVPFWRCASDDISVASIMVGHMHLPEIMKSESGHKKPCSVSREVVHDMLRIGMGYQGVIITDCLIMDGVRSTVGTVEGAVMALQAGNDIVMICHEHDKQREAILRVQEAVAKGEIDRAEIERSYERVMALKSRYTSWSAALELTDVSDIRCDAHLKLSMDTYASTTTVVRNEAGIIPLHLSQDQNLMLITPNVIATGAFDSSNHAFAALEEQIRLRHSNINHWKIPETSEAQLQLAQDADFNSKAKHADLILIVTANANLHANQLKVVRYLLASIQVPIVMVASGNPYDLEEFSADSINTYLTTYEHTESAFGALTAVLFGEVRAQGKLPVELLSGSTASNTTANIIVEDYNPQRDLNSVVALWDASFGDKWPRNTDRIEVVLRRCGKAKHFIVRGSNGDAIGFAATSIDGEGDSYGHLMLIMVHPVARRRGIGSALHTAAMRHLYSHPTIKSIQLGAAYPRFFCGVPENLMPQAGPFFAHRGWRFNSGSRPGIVYDLIQDVRQFVTPADITNKMVDAGIVIAPICSAEEVKEVVEFEEKHFPYWRWTYEHHADLGDLADLIVARDERGSGRVVGAMVIYSAENSSKERTDVGWWDESLFGAKCGGIACVGVDEAMRGKGIGAGLVAYGSEILRKRGVERVMIDWVVLERFYEKLGYKRWRGYYMSDRVV
ncbi:uncharacterized protein VTP21DRAFT_4793 [Calcarisporiella thermophila]|uniref:uncharacterized protein n=1 Tax=Calcarisporiella thermophila TaxID=911321 RepID=UPI003742901B